ncbi:hypothetical protein CDV57_06263 [Aspergillus fumigatus]|nr:hypothetical protein CDV57_06263 [Aspergillus fumigatus]
MAKPVSIHTHRGSQASCNLNADESTPPEQHKFPLTPPPTAERQAYDIVVCVCFENIQLHPQRFWSSGLTLAKRLSLNLSDFGPDELSDGYERKELSISYGTLVNLLNRTERIHQARESAPGLRGIESKRPIRKRKLRSSSPAEQLRSDDEAKRRRQEAQAEERTAASDKDYEPPSSRRRGAGKP